jgi:hypothetical protein
VGGLAAYAAKQGVEGLTSCSCSVRIGPGAMALTRTPWAA